LMSIRRMVPEDEGFFLKLISLTGWGNTAADFRRMLLYEPRGCFLASVDGVNVGMVNSTRYGSVGWIGNLVVHPGHRGGGIGAALMIRAIEHLTDSGAASIRLDAVEKAIPLYERLGFKAEHLSLRFNGLGMAFDAPDVEEMNSINLESALDIDARYFGADRERMLRRVFEDFPDYCFVASEEGVVRGYIMAKRGESNVRIGPWVCEPSRAELARSLLRRLMDVTAGEKLWIGVPEGNRASVEILTAHGFSSLPSSLRMCYGERSIMGDPRGRFSIGAADKG
jgi:GNAT superfamily N-acetyltransferase